MAKVELHELRSLSVLSRTGSLRNTAATVNLSPAAVHKQLKELEQKLGVKLYEKIGRRLQLTQAAEVVLPYANEVLAQLDAAEAAVEEWKGTKRGIVRIGAGPAISSYVLPTLLKQYRRMFPEVDLSVATGSTIVLLDQLAKGALDLALLISPDTLEPPLFRVEAHWAFEMALVSHRTFGRRRYRLAELHNQPFILFQKGSRMEEPIDRYFAVHGFRPRVVMRFDNSEAVKAMIQTGLGVSLLPMWIVSRDLIEGDLHVIRQQEPPLMSNIALVSRKSAHIPRPVESFIAQARLTKLKTLRPRRLRRTAATG